MPEALSESEWSFEPLSKTHERTNFQSGEPALDEFLTRYARQNQDMDISRTFVATPSGSRRVAGFYTLSTGSLEAASLPEEVRRRLPRYPIPVIHLGRLAVDGNFAGRGLGEQLLLDALQRSLLVAETAGAFAMEVVAKSERAREFYLRFGFRDMEDDALHLYLPMKTVRQALSKGK